MYASKSIIQNCHPSVRIQNKSGYVAQPGFEFSPPASVSWGSTTSALLMGSPCGISLSTTVLKPWLDYSRAVLNDRRQLLWTVSCTASTEQANTQNGLMMKSTELSIWPETSRLDTLSSNFLNVPVGSAEELSSSTLVLPRIAKEPLTTNQLFLYFSVYLSSLY